VILDDRQRGLSIPTMKDRVMQALHLLAFDPIAETTADPNSYGFRQGGQQRMRSHNFIVTSQKQR
jgi:retron-type reverse transcriptase